MLVNGVRQINITSAMLGKLDRSLISQSWSLPKKIRFPLDFNSKILPDFENVWYIELNIDFKLWFKSNITLLLGAY